MHCSVAQRSYNLYEYFFPRQKLRESAGEEIFETVNLKRFLVSYFLHNVSENVASKRLTKHVLTFLYYIILENIDILHTCLKIRD